MKIPYFCCIGAELKRYTKDFDFMNQVYLYKVPTDDSIDEVLAEDYFKAISDSVLQDDIVYIYEASAETLHECRFDKQNGHITAVPLASDETLTGAVTSIIHNNLTPNKLLKSDENGKVAVSDLNASDVDNLVSRVQTIESEIPDEASNTNQLADKAYVNSTVATKANTALSNLTDAGKNISNWSTNVSNCIIEIPQDIKLEVNNGTLILKSGSKIYKPNGSGVFDVINITTDKTSTLTTNGKRFIFINQTGNLQQWAANDLFSGETAPTSVHYPMWYDTANNVIKNSSDYGSTWSGSFSFPIAIVTVSNGTISSVDQVFNGFGYIGNTIFALPGVKAAYPDGRNADGTLKSGIISLTTVFKTDISYSLSDGSYVLLTPYSVNASPVIISDDEPEIHNYYERWHSPKLNKSFYHAQGATSWTQSLMALFGEVAKTSSAFTKFDAGQPFRAADYNDFQKFKADVPNQITTMLKDLYPVGSIYIGTQVTCPLATLIPDSTWQQIQGRYLLASGTLAGTSETYSATDTVAAGLPNVTGSQGGGGEFSQVTSATGAITFTPSGRGGVDGHTGSSANNINVDASLSNSTYGQSTTVRSPAYVVNVWRRTA